LKPSAHRWPLRAGLVTLAAIALLTGVVLLGGPWLLDLPVVKSRVEHKLSRVAGGHVAFKTLQIRLLPAPHVEMGGVVLELPGWGDARIEQAQVGLRLLPLLHGQPEFTSIAVLRPALRIDLPSSAPVPGAVQGQTSSDPVAAYRSAIGPLVRAARSAAPGALLEIHDADVELHGTLAPELRLRGLSVRVRTDSTGFNLEASAAGNLWDWMDLAGRLEFADLSANFGLDIRGLDAKAWLDDWFAGGWLHMDIPRADLQVRLVTDARTELRCDLGIDAASVRIAHAAHGLPVARSTLKATAALRAQGIEVTLSELQMGSLIPGARGMLHMNTGGEEPRLEVELPKLDVPAVRDFVIALVGPESPAVRHHATRALRGAMTHFTMRSQGENWNGLIRLDHLEGAAVLEHASLRLPFVEQIAQEVNGRIALAHAALELAEASAQVGSSRLSNASLRYSIRNGAVSTRTGFELELTQALTIARSALPPDRASALDDIEASAGRLHGLADFESAGADWNAGVNLTRSDALVRLRSLPWPVTLKAARAFLSPSRVSVGGVQLVAGSSKFDDVSATLALGTELRVTSGSGRATLALEEIYPWLHSHSAHVEGLDAIDSVSGGLQIMLNSLAGALSQPAALAFDVTMRPQQLRVGVKGWPATLTLDGGTVHADAVTARADRVGVAMLDARGFVSGELAGYRGAGARIRASLADAVVGGQCAHWIWQRTGAPPQFEPRPPLHIAVERFSFGPDQVVDTLGSVTFEAGPTATADLRWAPGALDVRSLAIRDQESDAMFGLHRLKADLLEATFSGSIFAGSIAAMFKHAGEYHGQAHGQLRVMLDLEHLGRTSAQGAITVEGLELDELLPHEARGGQARIDRLDLRADGSSLQIQDAAMRWAEQVATIRGRIARENEGVVVDVDVDSPGIQVDALLHRAEPVAQEAAGTGAQSPHSRRAALFSWMRTMAVSGRVRLRSDFVQFDHLRLAPLTAILTLGNERAELRLQEETRLCGLSSSVTMQIAPVGYTVSAQFRAQKQQVEEVAQCLTEKRVLLTGELDARADLTTNGELDELLANLQGSVHVESRNGVVRKFALIGNILAMTDISSVLRHGLSDLNASGFPYRTLELGGHLSKGRFIVDNLIFDSSAFGMGAEGSIGLVHRDTDLDVLVTPFSGLTNLIRQVPIIGPVPGEALTGIPVAVKGDIRNPDVVPLDPAAVASDLTGLVRRALNAPKMVLRPSRSGPAPDVPEH
jgi:AsmA-like C-terminal region